VIRWALKMLVAFVGLCCVLYVFFLVPLGERTLYQHVRRIAATDEAEDLGRELGEAGERLTEEIGDPGSD
jgi:hypothetical protein